MMKTSGISFNNVHPVQISPASLTEAGTSKITRTAVESLRISGEGIKTSRLPKPQALWQASYPYHEELKLIERAIDEKVDYGVWAEPLLAIHMALAKSGKSLAVSKTRGHLRAILNKLPENLLDQFLQGLVRERFRGDVGTLLDQTFKMLSTDKLKSLVSFKHEEVEGLPGLLDEIMDMAGALTQHYPKVGEPLSSKVSDQLGQHTHVLLRYFVNFARSFMKSFLKAHDFSTEDDPSYTRYDAEWRLSNFYQVIGKTVAVAGWVAGMMKQLSAKWWGTVAAAGAVVLAGYSGVKIYNHFFRSPLESLSLKCPNLVAEAKAGKIGSIVGRQHEVNTIIECLGDIDRFSKPPLLIGDPGVGKTDIVKALAKAIASEKYPHLKNKQLFLVTPSKLLEKGSSIMGYRSRLERLLQEIEGREDEVILFFDEIATLVREGGKGTSVNQLKTLIDSGKVHIIGATTTEEYKNTILKDPAFDSRFRLIHVKPLDHDECLAALMNIVNQSKYAGVPVDDVAMEKVMQLADSVGQDRAQIRKAVNLTVEAMNAVKFYRGPEKDELERTLAKLETARDFYLHNNKIELTTEEGRQAMRHLKILQTQVGELEEAVAKKQAEMNRFHSLRREQKVWKQRYINVAHELSGAKQSKKIEKLAREFLFMGEYVLQGLRAATDEKEKQLVDSGVSVRVDEKMMNRVFDEWRAQLISA